ncbi:MAG: hypothetical protein RR352_00885 [Clostridia bacterium]
MTCSSVASQYADVSVSLKLKPYAILGKLATECCGEPMITTRSCQGANSFCGCEITVTQVICIKIPIEYGTDANIFDTSAVCRKVPNLSTNPNCR